MKTTIKLSAIVTMLVMMSCSMEKRHYRNGYKLNWNAFTSNSILKKDVVKSETKKSDSEIEDDKISNELSELPLTASAENTTPLIVKPKHLNEFKNPTKDSCDVIEMKNGKTIRAKILEINSSTVKYKKCGDAAGPERIINKEEIGGITYSNGQKENAEQFKSAKNNNVEKPKKPEQEHKKKSTDAKRTSQTSIIIGAISILLLLVAAGIFASVASAADAVAAALTVVAGIFIAIIAICLSIMAIIFALKVLDMIKKNPENEPYKKRAKLGLLLGAITLALVFAALIVAAVLTG